MKKYIITGLLFIVIAGFACLFIDFNKYVPASKNISYEKNGVVFSITTYDGVTETKPFIKSLGHAWLEIDNYSGHSIYLKDYEIKNDETLTFSAWAISGKKGIYFNLEPHFARTQNRYRQRQSLSINIDEDQLKVIEDFIDNNDKWTSIKNCTYWSIHLWNKIVDDKYDLKTQTIVYTPKKLQKSILEYDCYETDKAFNNVGSIFFYNKGKREELKLCPRN